MALWRYTARSRLMAPRCEPSVSVTPGGGLVGECLRANPLGRCQNGGSYRPGQAVSGRGGVWQAFVCHRCGEPEQAPRGCPGAHSSGLAEQDNQKRRGIRGKVCHRWSGAGQEPRPRGCPEGRPSGPGPRLARHWHSGWQQGGAALGKGQSHDWTRIDSTEPIIESLDVDL